MTEVRFVQTNLNHCRAAQDLLGEFVRAEDIAVALVSEPQGGGRAGWHYDSTGRAAVAVFRPGLTLSDVETGDGFVAVTVDAQCASLAVTLPPPCPVAEFGQFLGRLEASVGRDRGVGVDLIVGGDFNAREGEVLGRVGQDRRRRPLGETLQGRPEEAPGAPGYGDDGTADDPRHRRRALPPRDGDGEPADLAGARSEDVTEFSVEEVSAAVSRFGSRCRAPGPDGIPSRVWSVVHAVSPGRLVGVFNLCLREGVFPGRWKRARLALLAKPGKPEGTPSSYRPLCLLDDVGKIFEFLLASRMNSHMSTTGVGLSEWQFGFRSGRCTDDALRTLRERLIAAVNARRYAAAVSLDIRNAFNTVGWGVVRAALVRMGFPAYVRRVLDSYLSERVLHVCDDHDGVPVTVGVTCGVPQGSVLGPLLWNVAFDTVFRLPLPAGATIIGYADDTLVVSEGNTLAALQDCANAALATVAGHIGDLGLRLAVDKTEAVVFKAQYGPADLRLRIGDQAVRVCESLKYLGIVHEAKGTWYGAHYRAAADKARRVMAALRGLMPNLGGPRESRRRLLTSVVHSVMLYGAPTWAPDLAYSRTGPKVLASVQRLAALSSVCAYRTVSYEAGRWSRAPSPSP
ncbi:hypothetical protein QTP88_030085 [Uroleucon formosanum]